MRYKVERKQHNSRLCFVCGLKNDLGLKAEFYETDQGEIVAMFTPIEEHQSYPGRMHGGIASAILDETIGRAVQIGREEQIWGVTLELKTRFHKPIPLDQPLKVVGRITKESHRIFEGSGEIYLPSGEKAVSAEGRYLKQAIGSISDFDTEENDWRVVPRENDPAVIELESPGSTGSTGSAGSTGSTGSTGSAGSI